MPTVDAARTKRADVVRRVAEARFQYPSEEQPAWRATVNFPDRQLGIQIRDGGWIYPDVAVTEEPGHFIQMLGVVTLRHEVTEAEAVGRWLPLAKAGALYLFVPAGQAGRANRLCQQHSIKLAGIRTWRHTTTFGLEIVEAYSGPDLFGMIAALLPEPLRPRAYRVQRVRIEERYGAPAPAQREAAAVAAPAAPAALSAGAESVAGPAPHAPAGIHLPPPSVFPFVIAAGAVLTAFGFVFPRELLGAGVATLVVGVGGWLWEDVAYFGGAAHAEGLASHQEGGAVHLPPPSLSPFVIALGAVLTALGFVFPAELLGAGITLIVMGVFGWIAEDVRDFAKSGQGGHG